MATEIRYREFYDVPRIFLVRLKDQVFLFESVFDQNVDEYSVFYDVYLLPKLSDQVLDGSWDELSCLASRKLGSIPVKSVQFDVTRRKTVETSVLDGLLKALST